MSVGETCECQPYNNRPKMDSPSYKHTQIMDEINKLEDSIDRLEAIICKITNTDRQSEKKAIDNSRSLSAFLNEGPNLIVECRERIETFNKNINELLF